jgi:hypothetical protein
LKKYQHLTWRIENKVDTIHSEDFGNFIPNEYPYTTDGTDREGRPGMKNRSIGQKIVKMS